MIGDHLSSYTYDYLLKQGLADIPDTLDKRPGSVVWDTIASAARLLSEGYSQMRQVYTDTFAQYAAGEALQLRAVENGIKPKAATKAIRKGIFTSGSDQPYDVPLGSRFSAIDGANSINYVVTERLGAGVYALQAETAGVIGNDYLGPILPIDAISDLKTAVLTDIIISGSDDEDDDSLRARYFDEKTAKRFGGNIAQYRSWVNALDGVGACQVYPVWAGGGTVKISAVDSQYDPLSMDALEIVQQAVDPTKDGQGLGTAPIGHIVTVSTPEEVLIDVAATVQIAAGFTLEQLRPLIEEEIQNYIDIIKENWGTAAPGSNDYSAYVFIAQVMAAMLRVRGVLNVTGLTLNGQNSDIVLQEDAQVQQIPKLGVVSLG